MESPKQEKSQDHESELTAYPHIRGLNGLRAFAVLMVLLRHNFHLFAQNAENAALLPTIIVNWNALFLNGWLGVDLFFVLSGFLISRPFFYRNKRPLSLKSYALKRILRVVPAYYFVMLLIIVGAFPFYQIPLDNIGWRAFYHMIFMQDYLSPDINTVFWSLGVEEKFYILTPLLFLILPHIKKDSLKLALLMLPILIAPILRYLSFESIGAQAEYYEFFRTIRAPFHNCMEPLFLGVCIAFCEAKKIKFLPPKPVFWSAVIGLFTLMASHEMLSEIGYFDVIIQPFLIALFMAGLVYGVVFGVELKILQNRMTDFIAKISYSLYLLHWPLFPLSFALATVAAGDVWPLFPLFTFIFCTLSIVAASLQYALIEKPFLSLKSRI